MSNVKPRDTTVPKTGQTTSYREGDDGDVEAGYVGTRYIDTGHGTIVDLSSYSTHPLEWVKQPELIIPGATGIHATSQIQVARGNWATETAYTLADLVYEAVGEKYYVCAVSHTSGAVNFATDIAAHSTYWRETIWTASAANLTTPSTMTWDDAIDACLALEYAGDDDWRLPNRNELSLLFDSSVAAPGATIDLTVFPNTPAISTYWTSTTNASRTTNADGVVFTAGFMSTLVPKFADIYLRPVRGGSL